MDVFILSELFYRKPANCFEEALPLGNGRLGGMHYAGVVSDKISLNEDTLWSGYPNDKSAPNPLEAVKKAKVLIANGEISKAEYEIMENCLGEWTESYQPAGNLLVSRVGDIRYEHYERILDLKTAISSFSYTSEFGKEHREVFVSGKDKVMIYHFESDNTVSFEILSESPHPAKISAIGDVLLLNSIAPSYVAPIYQHSEQPIVYDSFGDNRALSFCIGIRLIEVDGSFTVKNDKICITAKKQQRTIMASVVGALIIIPTYGGTLILLEIAMMIFLYNTVFGI